ncbi:MAG: SpoIIIAH-like family protein [Faecousia sp.]
MKVWKKNLVAIAMLLVVCGGIYINWAYTEDQAVVDLTDTLNSEKMLSNDLLVIGSGDEIQEANNTVEDYFAAVRLSRQEARDSAITLLQEAMVYEQDAEVSSSQTQLNLIVQSALTESQIESLVIAKGYADCVAYISDEKISIAVASPEGGIQATDVALIADIVMSQSDFDLEDIYVVEVP